MLRTRLRRRIGTAIAAAAVVAGVLVNVTAGGAAQAADCARIPSDFNGDGFADLAVGTWLYLGAPGQTPGAIEITYGSAQGFSDESTSQALTAIPPGIVAHGFAAGYFDGDCFADLITDARSGRVGDLLVFSGSANGIDVSDARRILSAEMLPAHSADDLGASFAVGDFDGDGFDDVAAGGPVWPDLSSPFGGGGVVTVLYGSAGGLTASTDHVFHQARPGVPGTDEPGDDFGYALAAADFTDDGFDDLAVGAPFEDVGAAEATGAVTILKGSADGIATDGSQSWHQNSPGVPGANELNDAFGSALAATDFDGDGHADLAIGIFHEGIGAVEAVGAVVVLRGASDGLSGEGAQSWHQGSPGVPGSNEEVDVFGWALAVGDLNADANPDLAIGVQRESIGSVAGAGSVTLLLGSPDGLTAAGATSWSQNSAGIPGSAEAEDRFGYRLASLPGPAGEAGVLVIAAPFEVIGPILRIGTVAVIPGGPSGPVPGQTWAWTPDLAAAAGTHPRWGLSLSS